MILLTAATLLNAAEVEIGSDPWTWKGFPFGC